MKEVAFLDLIIWKRRGAANLMMPDLNSTPKSTPRYKFSDLWRVPYQIYGPLNIIIKTTPPFWRRPPRNIQWLLQENDRDYDAQIFRIFITQHYLPPHLKWKKIYDMLRCTSWALTWNSPSLSEKTQVEKGGSVWPSIRQEYRIYMYW